MNATLRRLYKKPENVPPEVVTFLQELSTDYPLTNPTLNDTMPMIQHKAGQQAFIEAGQSYLRKL